MMIPKNVELNAEVHPDGGVTVSAAVMDEDGQVVRGRWPATWAVVSGKATVEPLGKVTEDGQAIARVTCKDDGPVLISCSVEADVGGEADRRNPGLRRNAERLKNEIPSHANRCESPIWETME